MLRCLKKWCREGSGELANCAGDEGEGSTGDGTRSVVTDFFRRLKLRFFSV